VFGALGESSSLSESSLIYLLIGGLIKGEARENPEKAEFCKGERVGELSFSRFLFTTNAAANAADSATEVR